jgi:hypothetical protein
VLTAFVDAIRHGLSHERLIGYRQPGDDDLAMLTAYFWNIDLCQSLYPSLGAVEVSLRNGIHDALSTHFGTAAWYDLPQLLLPREMDQVTDAKRKIRRARKAIIPPRMVAALDFGFWTSLLDAGYGNSIWAAKNPAVLVQQAFPQAPIHYQVRSRIHRRYNAVRILRNRVFHYEPVWQGVPMPDGRIRPLGDLHLDVIDAIGWVDPTLQATVAAFDRFPNMFQHGRLTIRWQLKHHLGLPWLALQSAATPSRHCIV